MHLRRGLTPTEKETPSPKLRKRGQKLNPLGLVLLDEVVEARKAIVAGGGAQLLCWIPTSKNNPLSQVEEEGADTKPAGLGTTC
jgi:hypothetical protein